MSSLRPRSICCTAAITPELGEVALLDAKRGGVCAACAEIEPMVALADKGAGVEGSKPGETGAGRRAGPWSRWWLGPYLGERAPVGVIGTRASGEMSRIGRPGVEAMEGAG